MVISQVAGFLFVSWLGEWRYFWPTMPFGLILPLYYLIALRGVVRVLKDDRAVRPYDTSVP